MNTDDWCAYVLVLLALAAVILFTLIETGVL